MNNYHSHWKYIIWVKPINISLNKAQKPIFNNANYGMIPQLEYLIIIVKNVCAWVW
jgi:hypothetical protein